MERRRIGSWVWALAPAYSLGFVTPAIMVHAAVRKRSWPQAATVPVYVTAWILMLLFAEGNGHDNGTLFGIGLVVNLIVGLVHAIAIRGWVFGPSADASPAPATPERLQAQALAQAQEAHKLRERARALLRSDPALAREVGVGRPDRPHRDYPDGGLVDVNHVPLDVLTGTLGMPAALAQQIVAARDQVRAFDSYDDLLMLLSSDGHDLADYADRMVFVPAD